MISSELVGRSLDPATRVLLLPLGAMAESPSPFCAGNGLPAGAVELAHANVILAATPCDAPCFRDALARTCLSNARDVVLVRTGFWPETLDPVTVDVAVAASPTPVVLTDLLFMRRLDGGLWLVPQRQGAYVEFRPDGLALDTLPPFTTWDERTDGLCRAAAEIVRIATRGRRG